MRTVERPSRLQCPGHKGGAVSMAHGIYPRELKADPGTCGGCVHFRRRKVGSYPGAMGTCKAKPDRWTFSQTMKACKKHYKGKEGVKAW